jgi:RNA polymerase sigma-70 factor (ECF subfamily)
MAQVGDDLHLDDLQWARELAAGDRAALARYEDNLVPMIDAQLRKRGYPDDQIADLQQMLRARLLVGDGSRPAIAAYEGRGKLRTWVLVAALREAVRQREKRVREPAVEQDALLALTHVADGAVADDTEKAIYREKFRAAFRTALEALEPRERNLLRLHVIDELTVDEIGALHGVHRATAARWIEQARETIAVAVHKQLMAELGTDPFETRELLQWIKSKIELSLSGLAKV